MDESVRKHLEEGLKKLDLDVLFYLTGGIKESIAKLRKTVHEITGHDIHIRLRICPLGVKEDGSGLSCPIEVVDDEVLDVELQFNVLEIPQNGYRYLCHLKQAA